jgi:hypothetical protein
MAAVYPHQYKSFTVHKNLVEDIDASHVNNLQDEVVAIQQTLGINPHQDTALKMKTNTWASVATRLDAVQRGKGIPACYLSKSADTVKGDATKVIAFARPAASFDPEGLFNGHSITTNRSGWWIVFGRVLWYNGRSTSPSAARRTCLRTSRRSPTATATCTSAGRAGSPQARPSTCPSTTPSRARRCRFRACN